MGDLGTMFRGAILAAIGLTAVGAIPALAAADRDGVDAPSATVRYQDLDLSTRAGQAKLRRRVSRAADRVCSFNDLLPDLAVRLRHECRQHALALADVRLATLLPDDAARQSASRRQG